MKALWSIPIAAALTCAALSAGAAEPLKQQLVGTWRVTSFVNVNERTGKTTQVFGSDPKGYFMFDAADHFSINLLRPGRPKYARRDFPMPGETRAALEGIVVMFGDYKVSMNLNNLYPYILSAAAFPRGTIRIRSVSSRSTAMCSRIRILHRQPVGVLLW